MRPLLLTGNEKALLRGYRYANTTCNLLCTVDMLQRVNFLPLNVVRVVIPTVQR